MNDFLKEVLEIARDTADGIFDRLESLVEDNEVYKKVKESGLVDVADFFKTDDDSLDYIEKHYNDPKNGFVNDDGSPRGFSDKSYRELEEEVAWLRDENEDLNNTLDTYKVALQVILDGSAMKIVRGLTYTRLTNITSPGVNIRLEDQSDDTITLTITQVYG